MFQANGQGDLGQVQVFTSNNSGHTPEQIAEMAMNKIMLVSETAPPPIRDQAVSYRNKVKDIIVYYLKKMAKVRERLFGHCSRNRVMQTWLRS